MRAAYLVSTEHAIELGNVFAEMTLMFFAVSSIIIGLVMLKGVFSKGVSYLVIMYHATMYHPLTILTLFGLILTAVWQIVVGIKLYKLG